jgi:hypothetical protein
MLGLAHHDGQIRALPWVRVASVGGMLLVAGLGWALSHPAPDSGLDLNRIPLAQALYSMGAVLLLLRAHPDFSWVMRYEIVAKFVGAVNSRAVTIYLWHSVAISLDNELVGVWWAAESLGVLSFAGQRQQFVVLLLRLTVVLLGLALFVIGFGWVEDVAARRKPRLRPWTRGAAGGSSEARRSGGGGAADPTSSPC